MQLQNDFAKKAKPLLPSRNNSKYQTTNREIQTLLVDMDSSDEELFIASSAATGRVPYGRRHSQPHTKTDDIRKR
jgi:hypothetical protein